VTRHRNGFVRGSLSLAIACALVPAGFAVASPSHVTGHKTKPVCNLVKPTSQNTAASNMATARTSPSNLDPALQITSADIATKGQTLTWVIRVKKLTSSYGTGTPTGRQYSFKFVANGVAVNMSADESQFGTQGTGTLPHSRATFDTRRNEIRESVPYGDIANQFGVSIRNGQTSLSSLYVVASAAVFVPGVGDPPYGSNETVGPVTATYLAGTPSCVKVGS